MVAKGLVADKQMVACQQWLVVLPDKPGAYPKRLEVRDQHHDEVLPDEQTGFWKVGGALLEEQLKDGEPFKIKGSFLLASAGSSDQVIQRLKSDIFFRHGVWDWEKLQIYPIKAAFFNP